MKNFFQRILNKKKKEFVFTTLNIARHTGNGDRIGEERPITNFISVGNIIAETHDNDTSTGAMISRINEAVTNEQREDKPAPVKEDVRKAVKPKDVFEEIKIKTPNISFDNLETKYNAVKERLDILKEHLDDNHLKDEHQTLFYLKNRMKYLKTMKKYPIDWAMTNREAIDDLCKRYQLKVSALKQYYTLVPKDGIKEMERYTKAYKAITGENPIFELIIKDSEVKEERAEQRKKDRDPILIANSPFGNFMFVIGAWDDEVEIVDEIIYGLK